MRHAGPSRPVFPVVLFLTACGSATGTDAGFQTLDSAGVALARNAGSEDRPAPWRLTELRRLGGADSGPQAFDRVSPRIAAIDRSDRIHILTEDGAVVVLDSLGNHLRSLGQKGGGPGEIEMGGRLSIASDGSIFVLDYLKGAMVGFDTAGRPLPQVSYRALGSPSGGLELDGEVIVIDQGMYEDTTRRLRYVTPNDTVVLMSIPFVTGGEISFKRCQVHLAGQQRVFDPGLQWTMRGHAVAVSRTDSYEVRLFEDGRPVRYVKREVVPAAATLADVARRYPEGIPFQVGNRKCPIPAEEWAEQTGVAERLPVIDGVRLGPDGTLWVARFTFPDEPSRVDVFDGRGRYLGTLRNLSLPVGFLSGGRVAAAVDDPDSGGQRLAIYALEPAPWH
jgi:hypothetical protein